MPMPAIVQILVIFACILMLSRLRVPLGLAVLAGGLILDLCGGFTPPAVLVHLAAYAASANFWLMMFVIVLIIQFGLALTEKDRATHILALVGKAGGKRAGVWAVMALPAAVGLIPMPGGALFSAPLVEEASPTSGVPRLAEWKTAVNYWFRHIWEYWWPLYLGVIVAMQFFDVEMWRFMAVQAVFTPVAVIGGYFFLVRPHLAQMTGPIGDGRHNAGESMLLVIPVAIVLVVAILFPLAMDWAAPNLQGNTSKLLAMILGLCAGALVIIRTSRHKGGSSFLRHVFTQKSMSTLSTVAGILVFKHLLEQSGLVNTACAEMDAWGMPAVVAVAVLPFLAGLVTGLAVGFAGIAFPLIVGLVEAEGSGLTPLATLMLAYGFGQAGMMLSPVHICLVVTKEYYRASLLGVLKKITPCAITVMLFAVVAYGLLSLLGL
jgi:integral membrane protein (TIGR00529 family)